jgi:type IV pilus assembly protein PilN
MRITLNLASRPFIDLGPTLKRLRIAMGVLAVLSIGMGLGLRALHEKAEQTRATEHSLDGAIAQITQERQRYMAFMHEPDNAQLLTQADALNQLFDQKAFSWTLAMENLETVLPGGVQVTSIEPTRAKDGHITLHLRVVGPHILVVGLVQNLEHSRRFLEPRIVGETAENNTGGPNQRLEPVSERNRFDFDLLAEYNPLTPDERKAIQRDEKTAPGVPVSAAHPPPAARRALPVPLPGAPRPPYMGPVTGPARVKPNPAVPGNFMPGGPR